MEKFQKIYQYSIKIDDTNVDKLLMMWKTAGGKNSYVEMCGKVIVLSLFLPDFSTVCWNNVEKIFFCFFISSINNVEKNPADASRAKLLKKFDQNF